MNLPSDIIQLFGTSGVPVVVAGTVLGVFELGERFASQRAKDALSRWLLTFDVQKAKALPDGTQEFFERIFGERHFSLKCFVRSAAFSVGATIFIAIVSMLVWPQQLVKIKTNFVTGFFGFPGWWFLSLLWIPWSIVIDYVSLLKTRLILRILPKLGHNLVSLVILGLDYCVYLALFVIGCILLGALSFYLYNIGFYGSSIYSFISSIDVGNIDVLVSTLLFVIPYTVGIGFIFFWSGFAPSLWLWLYLLALFVTRGLLRSEKLVNGIRWFLDVEKAPFRSIGAVAASLAFIASVAIILVSAEVSLISTA